MQFESTVVKIQRAARKGESSVRLSKEEKEAAAAFLKENKDGGSGSESEVEESFTQSINEECDTQALKKAKTESPYKSTNHCVSTPVMVETLFSRRGIIMRPCRWRMDPSALERLASLRSNKDLWGEEQVDKATKSSSDADVAPLSTPLSQSSSGSAGVLLDLDLDSM